MEPSGLLVEPLTMRDVLRSAKVDGGVLCVMITGQVLMLGWPADSLDFPQLVR